MKDFLNEYGYPIDIMKYDRSLWSNIEKFRFYSPNGAVFLIAYEVENEDVSDISSIYEKTKQDGDEYCSLLLVCHNRNFQC